MFNQGRIAPNGYRLCDPLSEGEILSDAYKKHWVIGMHLLIYIFCNIFFYYCKLFLHSIRKNNWLWWFW